jgi:hypothetical protein
VNLSFNLKARSVQKSWLKLKSEIGMPGTKSKPPETPEEKLKRFRRENRELKRYLKLLVGTTKIFLKRIEVVMKGPSTPKRGGQVAKLCNGLEMANDQARHFGLGEKL